MWMMERAVEIMPRGVECVFSLGVLGCMRSDGVLVLGPLRRCRFSVGLPRPLPSGMPNRCVDSCVALAKRAHVNSHHHNQIIETLQAYFPERLGRCLVNNGPFWLSILMKLIDPFMDAVTRSKMAVNRDFIGQGDFTADQVLKEWGGEREMVWERERYFNKLIEISGRMKEKRIAKWRELGGKVGLREWDYKEE